jgi:hypothetical protein
MLQSLTNSKHKTISTCSLAALKNLYTAKPAGKLPQCCWLRIQWDSKLFAGSGTNHSEYEQLRIRNEFEVKLHWKTGKI